MNIVIDTAKMETTQYPAHNREAFNSLKLQAKIAYYKPNIENMYIFINLLIECTQPTTPTLPKRNSF